MKAQKVINLLENSDDKESNFQTKKWYIINDQNNGQCGRGDENDSTIKFNSEIIKSHLTDYSDAYILVTGDIAAVGEDSNTRVYIKSCNVFTRCVTYLNDEHVETVENLNLVMNMYNLIEHSDNYEQSSGSLWQYKIDEQPLIQLIQLYSNIKQIY